LSGTPKVEYSEAGILNDTKNILYQNFVKKYCKLMQESLILSDSQKDLMVFIKRRGFNPLLFPNF